MAQAQSLYLRVGVLVVVGIALVLGFVLFLTADRLGRRSAATYETYIRESVQGLEVGAPVRYRGVAIGRVIQLGLVSAQYRRPEGEPFISAFQLVLVRFVVDERKFGDVPSVEDAIRLGLRARLAAQGITGVSYIELDFVAPDRFPVAEVPWEPDYAYVPAIPSTVAQVQSAAENLLNRLQEVDLPGLVANLNGLVSEVRGEVKDGDLAQVLRDASTLLNAVRATVDRAQVPETVAELRALGTDLRGVAAEAQGVLAGRELRAILANVAAATADLRTAAQRLPATMTSVDQTVRSARGTTNDLQAELGPVLRDLRAAMTNLRDTTELLRRYPSQAIFGAPPPATEGGGRR